MADPEPAKYACQGVFDDMVRCLSDSPCVINHKNKDVALSECARANSVNVPELCRITVAAYAQCRRAQADNRRRIRGTPKY